MHSGDAPFVMLKALAEHQRHTRELTAFLHEVVPPERAAHAWQVKKAYHARRAELYRKRLDESGQPYKKGTPRALNEDLDKQVIRGMKIVAQQVLYHLRTSGFAEKTSRNIWRLTKKGRIRFKYLSHNERLKRLESHA
jgi:hypothetical protein